MDKKIPLCFLTFVYCVLRDSTGYEHYADILDILTARERKIDEFTVSKLFNGSRDNKEIAAYFREMAASNDVLLTERFQMLKFQNLEYLINFLKLFLRQADLDALTVRRLLSTVNTPQLTEDAAYRFIVEVFKCSLACPKGKGCKNISPEEKAEILRLQELARHGAASAPEPPEAGVVGGDELNPLTAYLLNAADGHSPYSALCYDARTVDFYGREAEREALKSFCGDNRSILWWAVTGAGGTGKSRLAYEFSKQINGSALTFSDQKTWVARTLSWPDFYKYHDRQCRHILGWDTPHNLFLVIDYVSVYEHEIGSWIQWLLQSHLAASSKIRILLLERGVLRRDYLGHEFKPVWFQSFEAGWTNVALLKSSCYSANFIKLNKFTFEDGVRIVQSYCQRKGSVVDSGTAEKLVTLAQSINKGELSPLMPLCVAEVWLDSKRPDSKSMLSNYSTWGREKIFEHIVDREKHKISAIYKNPYAANIVMELVMISSIVGSIRLENGFYEKLLSLPHFSAYKSLDAVVPNLTYIDAYSNGHLTAIEPDLIGEYFVFTLLRGFDEEEITSLFDLLSELRPEETERFLQRFNNDFYMLIRKLPGYDHLRRMMKDGGGYKFIAIDEHGDEIPCEVLFTYESDETGKNYLVYTDNTTDEDGNTRVYASIYRPNDDESLQLEPIKTDEEWKIIEIILSNLQDGAKSASSRADSDFDVDTLIKKLTLR